MNDVIQVSLMPYLQALSLLAYRARVMETGRESGNMVKSPSTVNLERLIQELKEYLPDAVMQVDWGDVSSLAVLDAARLISGEGAPTEEAVYLASLLEQLRLDDRDTRPHLGTHHYPLKKLSPQTLFPVSSESPGIAQDLSGSIAYQQLWEDFLVDLKKLCHRKILGLWFEHFDSLMMVYTGNLPALGFQDVSLYDQARLTSALATAMYRYHQEEQNWEAEAIKNREEEKFLIINGAFQGIQKFIFREHGDTRKYRAKILRGRSLAVSLFSELAADLLCRRLGLPLTAVLLNAGGRFMLAAPNTERTKAILKEVDGKVNDWLIKITSGETTLGLSCLEAAADDFLGGKFKEWWIKIEKEGEKQKYQRFDLDRHGGPILGYLEGFQEDRRLCPFCGKRATDKEADDDQLLDGNAACKPCRDQVFLGTKIVKGQGENRLAIVIGTEIKNKQDWLLESVFEEYQVTFGEKDFSKLAAQGQLRRCWDVSLDTEGKLSRPVAAKFFNGYVPLYGDKDEEDERYWVGGKSDAKKDKLYDGMELWRPKTFEALSDLARNIPKPGSVQGLAAMGVLKADVDYLGELMGDGLTPKRFTLSRLAGLSRRLDHFFTIYLPDLLLNNVRFQNIYTVFGGGDDLFLIGPWNRTIELACELRSQFEKYVGNNPEVHFSGGISLQKPHAPLDFLGKEAEEVLKISKDAGRQRLTLFGETVTWKEMEALGCIKTELELWHERGWLNNAMLFRLNELLQMAGEERRVVQQFARGHGIKMEDMDCTRWHALLDYFVARKIGKKFEAKERAGIIENVRVKLVKWLTEHGSSFRIPVWNLLYDRR